VESRTSSPKCNARKEETTGYTPFATRLLCLDGVLALREVHLLLLLLLGDPAGLVICEPSPPGAGFLGLEKG
jgi:hypothetical protein